MGYYFNPPQELPVVARRIEGSSYEELTSKLHEGEKLFGHYDRLMFQNAVHLYSLSLNMRSLKVRFVGDRFSDSVSTRCLKKSTTSEYSDHSVSCDWLGLK